MGSREVCTVEPQLTKGPTSGDRWPEQPTKNKKKKNVYIKMYNTVYTEKINV